MKHYLAFALAAVIVNAGSSSAPGRLGEPKPPPKVVVVVIKPVKVVKVSPNAITVLEDGTTPKEIPFTPGFLKASADGTVSNSWGLSHRVFDVQVGDLVGLDITKDTGVELCKGLGIWRRPGGKVPPAIESPRVAEENRWHTVKNAEQAWEEKGIPLPKNYLDKDGRYPWTNPPYPPVAPMPREVKP